MTNTDIAASDVVGFWKDAGPQKWFERSPEFDAEILEKFQSVVQAARIGRYDRWIETAEGALALLILLDQFSRNIFRNSPLAFASDEKALKIAVEAVDLGFDNQVDDNMRQWFYLPFMHSENLHDQVHCIVLCHNNGLSDTIGWAIEHADIIRRFGRFPHRNGVLGRTSTPEELAFLEAGGFAG